MKKFFLLLTLLTSFTTLKAAELQSMRDCMLLPIEDNLKGAVSFKVYEEVERYLKSSEWCQYKNNSEILNILGNYKTNLSVVLKNKDVLRVISEKTRAGSLIFVNIENQIRGIDLEVQVIGENGEDTYFKQESFLNNVDVATIAGTVRTWLEVYAKSIPYDARVVGVLGKQFTIDRGKNSGMRSEGKVAVVRAIQKKKHPLFKEIVDWETVKVGDAEVIFTSDFQSQGRMTQYVSRRKVQPGDWVILDDKEIGLPRSPVDEDEDEVGSFGQLGQVSVMLGLGKGSALAENASTTKKIGGRVLGIELRSTIWVTRNFWGGFEIARRMGTYEQEEGSISLSENSFSSTDVKIKGGYKYLPTGFFYGPQVDVYGGFASLSNSFDTSTSDGFVKYSLKGLMLGAKGSLPIRQRIRAWLDFGFLFNPGYSEETTLYGDEDDGTSAYFVELGGSYQYVKNISLDVSLGYDSNRASFDNPTRSIRSRETLLRVGATYTF